MSKKKLADRGARGGDGEDGDECRDAAIAKIGEGREERTREGKSRRSRKEERYKEGFVFMMEYRLVILKILGNRILANKAIKY